MPGGIQTGVELYDGFTAPLNNIISAINLTVSAFEDFQRISGAEIDTASLDGAREAADRAAMAVQAMSNALSSVSGGGAPDIPQPEAPAPVEVPVVWRSDNMPVFTDTGIDRFQQEIQSAENMMNALNQTQEKINAQAAATNIFPQNAITDLNSMQSRIQAIQNRINQIAHNPINMGSDAANAELEQLRAQLAQALDAQEILNGAVDNMDVERANAAYERLSQIVSGTERYIRDNVDEQGRFNDTVNEGAQAADNLANMIKKAVAGFAGMAGIKKAFDFINESTDLFNTQLNAEIQLSTVLGNMLEDDVGGAFDAITAKASEIQGLGIYGDEAMIAGAAELATYFSDADALLSMMDTLSNYAMGMSGGGELDSTAMVDYATGIGKIMSGSYDAMTKKGFEFSDAQKAVIEGTATQAQYIEALGADYASMSDDMRAATVINDIIAESWDGLYEAMSNTPQGKIIQLNNAFGDLKEQVGAGVYPYIVRIADSFNENWGTIEVIISNVTGALEILVGILGWIAEGAMNVAGFFIDNWSWISPIIYGVVAAMTAYVAVLGIYNAIQAITNGLKAAAAMQASVHAAAEMMEAGATFAATAAQHGLNAALLACPLTWIVIAIIAVIAAIYAAVAAVNHFAGTSVSATGIIMGVFASLGAFLYNLVLGAVELVFGAIQSLINPFINIANFIGNVFTNPVSSIIYLFQGMADTVLSILQKIASALDFVFGSNMADTVQGWRDSIKAKADDMVAEYAPDENYQAIMDTLDFSVSDLGLDRIAYSDAWEAGYSLGEGIDESIANFSLDDFFGVDTIDPNDYISAYNATGTGTGLANDVSDIANNTGSIADSLDVTDEELKYLRDIAEQETVNRFTTADISIDMSGMQNNISNGMDLDGVVDGMIDGVNEAVEIATEGVHT